jgi:hypothetical protein
MDWVGPLDVTKASENLHINHHVNEASGVNRAYRGEPPWPAPRGGGRASGDGGCLILLVLFLVAALVAPSFT